MKTYLFSGVILLLIAEITLAGNSLDVTGQSDLDILTDASNAAANATADAIKEVEDNSGSAPNATQLEL